MGPELGQFKVAAVTGRTCTRFLAHDQGTPRQANLILAAYSKSFSLAELWQMRRQFSVLDMAPSRLVTLLTAGLPIHLGRTNFLC